MVLSHPIVTLVYKRMTFDERSVEMTAAALVFYSIGMVGQAAGLLLTRGFYSLQDTRTPLKISVFQVILNLGLSLVLIRVFQHAGLAMANSLANLVYMVLLMWYLGKKIPGLYQGRLFKFTLAVVAAAGLMAAASYAVNGALAGLLQGTAGLIVQVGLAVTAGVTVFVAAVFVMGVEEAHLLWRAAKKALAGRRA
jgi:putative peptidoglycan lipid II flippase